MNQRRSRQDRIPGKITYHNKHARQINADIRQHLEMAESDGHLGFADKVAQLQNGHRGRSRSNVD